MFEDFFKAYGAYKAFMKGKDDWRDSYEDVKILYNIDPMDYDSEKEFLKVLKSEKDIDIDIDDYDDIDDDYGFDIDLDDDIF